MGAISWLGAWVTEEDLLARLGWNRGQLDRFAGLFTVAPFKGLEKLVGGALPPE
jgi:hypothetical protein